MPTRLLGRLKELFQRVFGAPVVRGRVVRVATYNIRHGEGRDGVVDLERTAGVIGELDADLVALQELDRGLPRSGGIDQAARLGELAKLFVRFFPTLKRGPGEYGIALAAKGRFDADFRLLPQVGEDEPRGVIVARWRDMGILATHLSRDPASRAAQTAALARLAGGLEPPVLIMGDLNQGSRELGPLEEAGFKPARRRFPTVGRRQLDHIIVGSGLRVARMKTGPLGASDHRPLVAEIELRERAARDARDEPR